MESTDYSRRVTEAVNAIRHEAKISVLALAKASGIPNTTLDRKLRGIGDLTMREAAALAAALGTPLSTLLAEHVERVAAPISA